MHATFFLEEMSVRLIFSWIFLVCWQKFWTFEKLGKNMKSGVQNFVGDIHDGDVFICTIFALGEIIAMTSTSEKFSELSIVLGLQTNAV